MKLEDRLKGRERLNQRKGENKGRGGRNKVLLNSSFMDEFAGEGSLLQIYCKSYFSKDNKLRNMAFLSDNLAFQHLRRAHVMLTAAERKT